MTCQENIGKNRQEKTGRKKPAGKNRQEKPENFKDLPLKNHLKTSLNAKDKKTDCKVSKQQIK